MTIAEFLSKLNKINPDLDFDFIEKACLFAQEKYQGLVRLSGETYFEHCLKIALDVAKLKLGKFSISAAILHESLERAGVNKAEQRQKGCFYKNKAGPGGNHKQHGAGEFLLRPARSA